MERDTGIITRLTKLTESSLIVHWFTAEFGLIKTVAKGARRAKNPFAGQLDLFVEAELVWTVARSGELHALREVQVLSRRRGISASYSQTATAAYFCQLLETVIEPSVPVPEMNDLLRRGLIYLEDNKADRKALRHFEKSLAIILGIYQEGRDPALAIESHCGRLPESRKSCWAQLKDS